MHKGKISVQLDDQYELVAELNDWDPDAKDLAEICVFVREIKTGLVHQDLLVIGKNYVVSDDIIPDSENLAVRVYSDPTTEDYTHKFIVPLLKEG